MSTMRINIEASWSYRKKSLAGWETGRLCCRLIMICKTSHWMCPFLWTYLQCIFIVCTAFIFDSISIIFGVHVNNIWNTQVKCHFLPMAYLTFLKFTFSKTFSDQRSTSIKANILFLKKKRKYFPYLL